MKLHRPFTVFLVAALAVCWTYGQEGAPLTSSQVKGFVGALAELKVWGEEHADEYGDLPLSEFDGPEDAASPLTAAVAAMAGHAALNEIETILKRHGFGSAESWAQIGDRIIRAYASVKLEAEQRTWPPRCKKRSRRSRPATCRSSRRKRCGRP